MRLRIGMVTCTLALAAIVVGYGMLANDKSSAPDSAAESATHEKFGADALNGSPPMVGISPPRDGVVETPVVSDLQSPSGVESMVLDLGNLDETPWKYRNEQEKLAARPKPVRRQIEASDRSGPALVRQARRPIDTPSLTGDAGGPLDPIVGGRVQVLPGPGQGDNADVGSLPAPTSADLELPGPEAGIMNPDSAGPSSQGLIVTR